VILAHFTANDTSSVLLVLGLAAMLLGARRLAGRGSAHRRRAVRMLLGGTVAMAAGIAAGLVHTGFTSPGMRR
jgi:hypothetical protein